ncbi:CRT10-domain-containing protein [Dipodascopsis tothii]|uniref:CRT10-domain-containing protein n=1 Tax=Dipodascopsis tothii TaxID=44089 RepID=UPI0034CD1E0F
MDDLYSYLAPRRRPRDPGYGGAGAADPTADPVVVAELPWMLEFKQLWTQEVALVQPAVWKNNLVAVSAGGLLFVADGATVLVYRRTGIQGLEGLLLRMAAVVDSVSPRQRHNALDPSQPLTINHIRVGMVGGDELLAVLTDAGTVTLYSCAQIARTPGRGNREVRVQPEYALEVAMSAWGVAMDDERRVVVVSDNSRALTVFRLAAEGSEQMRQTVEGAHASNIPCVQLATLPDGLMVIVSVAITGDVRVWDAGTLTLLAAMDQPQATSWTVFALTAASFARVPSEAAVTGVHGRPAAPATSRLLRPLVSYPVASRNPYMASTIELQGLARTLVVRADPLREFVELREKDLGTTRRQTAGSLAPLHVLQALRTRARLLSFGPDAAGAVRMYAANVCPAVFHSVDPGTGWPEHDPGFVGPACVHVPELAAVVLGTREGMLAVFKLCVTRDGARGLKQEHVVDGDGLLLGLAAAVVPAPRGVPAEATVYAAYADGVRAFRLRRNARDPVDDLMW